MKLPQSIQQCFLDVLKQSKEEGLELGSFGLYLPAEDRVLSVVHPKELSKYDFLERKSYCLRFHHDLIGEIAVFNRGLKDKITIGSSEFNQKEGRIFGYHTHPQPDQSVAPSGEDNGQIFTLNSPLEIVISAQAEKYWPEKPFVVAYEPKFFPAGKNRVQYDQISPWLVEEEAKKLSLPPEVLSQFMYCSFQFKLQPSIEFEIEKE